MRCVFLHAYGEECKLGMDTKDFLLVEKENIVFCNLNEQLIFGYLRTIWRPNQNLQIDRKPCENPMEKCNLTV